MLRTAAAGLSDEEAAARLHEVGPNNVAQERQRRHWTLRLLLTFVCDPLSILLDGRWRSSPTIWPTTEPISGAIIIGAIVRLERAAAFLAGVARRTRRRPSSRR